MIKYSISIASIRASHIAYRLVSYSSHASKFFYQLSGCITYSLLPMKILRPNQNLIWFTERHVTCHPVWVHNDFTNGDMASFFTTAL